ncbi:MAG: DUF6249 domain-containing protein [Marinicella sp.]
MNTTKEIIEALHEPIMSLLGIGFSFVALYIGYKTIKMRNNERMAMILNGKDPNTQNKPDNTRLKRNGLMLMAIGIGIILGYSLNQLFSIVEYVAYPSMILFLCGGLLLYLHQTEK